MIDVKIGAPKHRTNTPNIEVHEKEEPTQIAIKQRKNITILLTIIAIELFLLPINAFLFIMYIMNI